jgi:hypothetical protein
MESSLENSIPTDYPQQCGVAMDRIQTEGVEVNTIISAAREAHLKAEHSTT